MLNNLQYHLVLGERLDVVSQPADKDIVNR